MKLIITTDWHYTADTPERRLDNYPAIMTHKIQEILNRAQQEDAPILHGGDLTDTPFLSYSTFCKLHSLLYGQSIVTIYGQHDLRYRNRGNTPLDALAFSLENFEIIPKSPVLLSTLGKNEVYVYGSSFGEDVPTVFTKGFNILLIHRMILGQEKESWEIENGYSDGEEFLRKYKDFDLIISGDNHKSHVQTVKSVRGERHLINCGSLMRMTIKQLEHRPRFYVFDTITRKYEECFLRIEPSENVFDLEVKVKSEEVNQNLTAFLTNLAEHKSIGLNFEEDLVRYEEENKITSDLVEIRRENMT